MSWTIGDFDKKKNIKTLTMHVRIKVIGADGKSIDKSKTSNKFKRFLHNLNLAFFGPTVGTIIKSPKMGCNPYYPILDLQVATANEKVDYTLRFKNYPSFDPAERFYIRLGKRHVNQITPFLLEEFKDIGVTWGLASYYHATKTTLKVRFRHMPAMAKFVKDYFNLTAAKGDPAYISILGDTTKDSEGAWAIPRYFQKWADYLNGKNANAQYKPHYDTDHPRIKHLLFIFNLAKRMLLKKGGR